MKTFVVLSAIFLSIIFLANNSIAQDEVKSEGPKNTFNFYFINGYAISYNFYEASSYYLRAGLDISTSKSDIDSDGETVQYYTNSSEDFTTSTNSDNSYFAVGASIQIVFPVYSTKYGSIYLGTGPVFTYSTSSFDNSETRTNSNPNPNYNSYTTSISQTNYNYDLAAIFLLGMNAIITENFGLFVEANIKGGGRWVNSEWEHTYSYSPTEYNKTSTNSDGSGWFYEAQFIRMGVSISL